jgi:hypothetical protein
MSSGMEDHIDVLYNLSSGFSVSGRSVRLGKLLTALAGSIVQDARGPDGYFSEGDIIFLKRQMSNEKVYAHLVRSEIQECVADGVFIELGEDKYQFDPSLIKPREFDIRPEYLSNIIRRRDTITKIVRTADQAIILSKIQGAYESECGEKWDQECKIFLSGFQKCSTRQLLLEALSEADLGYYKPRGMNRGHMLYWDSDSQKKKWKERIKEQALAYKKRRGHRGIQRPTEIEKTTSEEAKYNREAEVGSEVASVVDGTIADNPETLKGWLDNNLNARNLTEIKAMMPEYLMRRYFGNAGDKIRGKNTREMLESIDELLKEKHFKIKNGRYWKVQ